MESAELRTVQTSTNRSISQILNDSSNSKILVALNQMSNELKLNGYTVDAYSTGSLFELDTMTQVRKDEITSYLQNWHSWIQGTEIEPLSRREKEIFFAKRSLKHFGLKASDEFWLTYRENQIIEVYGENMIQLYRSMNFFELCGYSLLDISVFQWYRLWNRSQKIVDMMMADAQEVMTNLSPCFRFRVPPHLLLQTLNTGDTLLFQPRATAVQFQYMGALKDDAFSNRCIALICTSTAQTIGLGEEIENIKLL